MFNETVYGPYYEELNGVASDAIDALKNTPSQTNAGSSIWRDLVGIGLSTAGAVTAALANRPRAVLPPAPANVPVNPPPRYDSGEQDSGVNREDSKKSSSIRFGDKGIEFGDGNASISYTTILFFAGAAYLLFKEPPRRSGR